MSTEIPPALRQALRDYQRNAIRDMQQYIAAFRARKAHAGLVQMPTGSGKTGVIATLARCETRSGPVIVIAPRVGVREQLARHIRKRFFEHANVDPGLLARNVIELRDGQQQLGDLNQLVVVTTVQLLTSINKRNIKLWTELRQGAVLVLFDEGHYEPAPVWSQAVRSFSCPRIIFTATAFRDDFKTFDIDPNHVFRYSFHQARRERYVRDVRLHDYAPVQSPIQFTKDVLDAYDKFFNAPRENNADRPRVIIRCDRPEEIRQISSAIRQRDRSVIGIHETFRDDVNAGEYLKVPNPDQVDATFWVHQFKLLEGIDDPRFQMLALFGELRSVRSFVQQVGRIIRKSTAPIRGHGSRRWGGAWGRRATLLQRPPTKLKHSGPAVRHSAIGEILFRRARARCPHATRAALILAASKPTIMGHAGSAEGGGLLIQLPDSSMTVGRPRQMSLVVVIRHQAGDGQHRRLVAQDGLDNPHKACGYSVVGRALALDDPRYWLAFSTVRYERDSVIDAKQPPRGRPSAPRASLA